MRFSPHVLVFLLTILAAVPPLKGTVVSFVFWWWDSTYRQVDYVMDEARPNEGVPYIAGHLAGSTEQNNMPAVMRGGAFFVEALPQEAFAPGKTITIWHSDEAPNFIAFGQEINDVAVASIPHRPGLLALVGYLVWFVATFIVGFNLMAWVARRWSRDYGDLPMRGRSNR